MKTINVDSHNVPATARSKNYQTALATTASSGGGATTPSTVTPTGGAADTAKVAQNLAEDSTDWAKILRKDIDERTENAMSIGKNLTVDGQAILNDVVADTGTFSGMLKAAAATITGALLASTVSATTMDANTFIGELQGNAATATKLKTTHKIFGNDFNGLSDVKDSFRLNGVAGGVFDISYIDSYVAMQTYNNRFLSINADGAYVGIGTTSPAYKLDVIGTLHASGAATLDSGLNVTGNVLATGNVGIGTTNPLYKLDVNGTLHAAGAATLSSTLTAAGLITANGGTHTTALTATALSTLANTNILGDAQLSARVMSPDYVSQTKGWGITRSGAADFRNIYADELRVQAFTADISQALAGSDYLTKSVSKLSANFVVPSVNSTVRIIVDDIEGMPATQCFTNGDYIRFRAFNRTSGLTIANVWGTVVLDTTFGTKGFLNGTQAYTFTCKATSGAGLTVFKGSEVLDYGTSGSGMIARTTLDAMGSPYEQIATWVNDPSNGNNYTVHARLGNLNGIANCNGYGLYTDNGFFTGKIVIGDLTKTANFLSFDAVNGLQIKLGGTSVATTTDVNNSLTTANTNAQGYAATAQTNAINTASSDATTKAKNAYSNAVSYTNTQITATNNSITAAVNGIQIGGRNLLNNSNFSKGFNYWIKQSNTTYTILTDTNYGHIVKVSVTNLLDSDIYTGSYAITNTGLYTISAFIKADSQLNVKIGIGANFSDTVDVTTDWQRIVVTGTVNSLNHNVFFAAMSLGVDYYIANVQLEEGNKVTTYNISQKDVDASISAAQSTAISTAASNAAALYVTQSAYSSQVTILQNSINAKVSQTDFNALGTRVGTAESTITQHSTAIASKVSQTDYNGNNIASLINQTATTVAIQASKINLVGAVTIGAIDKKSVTPSALGAATPTDVTTAVNGIQIGGVNFIFIPERWTQFGGFTWNETNKSILCNTGNYYNYTESNPIQLNVNDNYTLSFNCLQLSGTFIVELESRGSASNKYTLIKNKVSLGKNEIHGLCNQNLPTGDTNYTLRFFGFNAGTSVLCEINDIKLEEGNKATSWTPAPEDVDANIAAAQSDATAALTRNNTMAAKLGYTDYNDLASAAALGHTLIDGGLINTQLINAKAVVTNGLTANCITANMIASGAVTTDKLAAKAATIDKIDTASLTAAQAFIDDFNANVVNTKRLNVAQIVADGIAAQTIDAQNATFENLNVTSASIYNGTIYNLRSPWEVMAGSFSQSTTDNIIVRGSDTGYTIYHLSWDNTNIGRFIRLADTNGLEGSTNSGSSAFFAETGKYFYINGNRLDHLYLNHQIAELIGIGVNGVFMGWAVLNIKDLMPTSQYGSSLDILAQGKVTGTSTSASISYRMFNGGYMDGTQYTMSVSRLSEGLYRISFPTQWGLGTNYMVMATGYGAAIEDGASPIKATIKNRNDGYFDVWISDDETVNDGSFAFQMFNMNDI